MHNALRTLMEGGQFGSFLSLMRPLMDRKVAAGLTSNDLDIETLMISAQIVAALPSIARSVYNWIMQDCLSNSKLTYQFSTVSYALVPAGAKLTVFGF